MRSIGPRTKGAISAYATGADPEWYSELGFTAHKFPHRWTGGSCRVRGRGAVGIPRSRDHGARRSTDDRHVHELGLGYDRADGRASRTVRHILVRGRADAGRSRRSGGAEAACEADADRGREHEFTHIGFDAVANAGAMDLWQPDITWCGGITAGLRILDIARSTKFLSRPIAAERCGDST